MRPNATDPVMEKARAAFAASGLSYGELGYRMGFREDHARAAAWQFLKRSNPTINSVRRFARAVGIDLRDLVG